MPKIYHITTRKESDDAAQRGRYAPASLAADGFIHCSHAHQLVAVANTFFASQLGLVVIEIDPAKLHCEVLEENAEGGAEKFPHIYGEVPWSSVERVLTLAAGPDGAFVAPSGLNEPGPKPR
ncbi:MAG: DUF952 domain-containing protein [Opitutaceae bacterium]|jgi:uncharacterized protein (DUF952 family)